ncbi:MAG: hypothetical protein HY292_27720 [Planctomycetes bacterium]|nr:hypothetical protein [Planctomycetota bacterium]
MITHALLLLALTLSPEQIRMRNGSEVNGELVEVKDKTVVLRVRESGGVGQIEVPFDAVDRYSLYRLWAPRVETNGARARIALARWCLDANLPFLAQRQLDAALAAAPELKGEIEPMLDEVHVKGAKILYDSAVDAVDRSDFTAARRRLSQVLTEFSDEPVAADAERLLAGIADREMAEMNKRETEVRRRLEARATQASKEKLDEAARHHEHGEKADRDGLARTKDSSYAFGKFREAMQHCRAALRAIRDVQKTELTSDGADAAASLARDVKQHLAQSAIHLSSLYSVRRSYHDAATVLNEVLADDPDNGELLAARARVELAAAQRYGYVRGRGRYGPGGR